MQTYLMRYLTIVGSIHTYLMQCSIDILRSNTDIPDAISDSNPAERWIQTYLMQYPVEILMSDSDIPDAISDSNRAERWMQAYLLQYPIVILLSDADKLTIINFCSHHTNMVAFVHCWGYPKTINRFDNKKHSATAWI